LKRLKTAECDQYLTFFFDLKDFTEKISLILKRERERERERERKRERERGGMGEMTGM